MEDEANVPRLTTNTSSQLFALAKTVIPGRVHPPVPAFGSVGGTPLFIESAKGSSVRDVDGNTFIDYVGSRGPMILGHAPPAVVSAIKAAAGRGTSYGAPTPGGRLDGGDDRGGSVPEDHRSPRPDVVDEGVPVHVADGGALRALDEQGGSPDGPERADGRVDPARDHRFRQGEQLAR